MHVAAAVPRVSDITTIAAVPMTNTHRSMNDPGRRVPENSLNVVEIPLRSLLPFASSKARRLNSEGEGERVLFILCEARLLPRTRSGYAPGQSDQKGTPFNLLMCRKL